MKYFNKEFISFFKELEKNNSKEWFHSNKKQYEEFVKIPMQQFVADVVVELQKFDAEIIVEPKKCIGRINRDIRFSKDKTPYKICSFANITKGHKSDPIPIIAFQMGAKDLGIMSGYYQPIKERLKSIRDKIKSDPKQFKKLYTAKEFVSKYGSIQGEANKRIPPEYKDTFKSEPLIANKQFYFVKEFNQDIILSDQLLPLIVDYWKASKPLNNFFTM